jgi:type III pantothenate kinase
MLLAIDAGNTNMVFGVFDGEILKQQWRLSTDPRRTADEYGLSLLQLFSCVGLNKDLINHVIISTVVPSVLFSLKRFCQHYLSCVPIVIGECELDLGIRVEIERAAEVGADRLVNSAEAFRRYGCDSIVIDFGTATTFDVISKEGGYLGGVIAPGINLSLEALHSAAAKLPKIAVQRPHAVIGSSTVSAMQSGIYWGYIGLIEGIVTRIHHERLQEKHWVIATGGLAPLFAKGTSMIDVLEPDLMLLGLATIFRKNGFSACL